MKEAKTTAHIIIKGRVQGVGYRFFAQESAAASGLTGWVRNLPTDEVEIEVEGPRPIVDEWIEQLRKGPYMARVENIQVTWMPFKNHYPNFTIR